MARARSTSLIPGPLNADRGPGARLDSKGLIGTIFQRIANQSRGNVWITEDRNVPGAECEYVTFSYFPKAGKICLLNVDFDRPHRFFLHNFGKVAQITLAPGEFRTIETTKLGDE